MSFELSGLRRYSLVLPAELVGAGIAGRVLRIVRNYVLVLGHTSSVQTVLQIGGCEKFAKVTGGIGCGLAIFYSPPTTYQTIATSRSLSGGTIGDTVAAGRVEAEQLGADSFVLKAGGSAAVTATLRVQREQRTGQGSAQSLILVRGIM